MRLPWNRREADLDREIQFHLEELAAEFERQGCTPQEARRRARVEFSRVGQTKDECRDQSPWRWVAGLRQDLTFGVRMLRKTPAVTAAAVISLAFGIGVNTAIFSLMDALLWKPVAVPGARQVCSVLWQSASPADALYHGRAGATFPEGGLRVSDYFSYSTYRAMREQASGKAELAAYIMPKEVSTSFEGRTAILAARPVSEDFFGVLRLTPFAGRTIGPDDSRAGAAPVAVVSYSYWSAVLRSDPRTIGAALRINNKPYTIIGVLPASFRGIAAGDATDVYIPLRYAPQFEMWHAEVDPYLDADFWWTNIIARRAAGVSAEALKAQLDAVFRQSWIAKAKKLKTLPEIRIEDGSQGAAFLRREFRRPLLVLLVLVGLVLLAACTNIANLLLARGDARRKEIALRFSLGCSRARLMRQLLTESAMLAALGGLASAWVGWFAANSIVPFIPNLGGELRLAVEWDARLVAATLGLTLVAIAAFGLFPAWRGSRMDLTHALKEGSGSAGAAARSWWTPGKVLVIAQVALAFVLVTAAALFARNLARIAGTSAGFDRDNLLVFDLRPGEIGYQGDRLRRFYSALLQRLAEVPGVRAAGLSHMRPLAGFGEWQPVRTMDATSETYEAAVSRLTPGMFDALGLRLLAGRPLTDRDTASGARTALLSEDLARQVSGGKLLPGARFRLGEEGETVYEVVGVVAPAAYNLLTESHGVVYLPGQTGEPAMSVTVRTTAPPLAVLPAVRAAVRELDKDLPIVAPMTMEQQVATQLKRERLFAYLCGGFGLLALVLSAVGLYGVMSYAAVRRQREIGIRMAVGATRAQVAGLVIREGLALAALGFLIAAPAALYGSRFIAGDLYRMKPLDPASLAAGFATLALVALAATAIPAIRAARVDPLQSLRAE